MKVSQNPNYLNVKNAFWFENKIKKFQILNIFQLTWIYAKGIFSFSCFDYGNKRKRKTDIVERFGRIEPLIEKSKVLRHWTHNICI